MKKKNIEKITSKSLPFLFILVFLFLISGSLNNVADWVLSEQIAMADNFEKTGSFYPSSNDLEPSGVSIYFPGNAIISLFFIRLGLDFHLTEVMLLLACLIIILFVFIQIYLFKSIFKVPNSSLNSLLISISVIFVICPDWLSYASAFKPDTVSYLLGFCGIVTANFLRPSTGMIKLILGSALFSIAILFKQQYIAFLGGIILYSAFNFRRETFIFSFLSTLLIGSILFFLLQNDNIKYWNVQIVADDGIVSFLEILRSHILFGKNILSSFCAVLIIFSYQNINIKFKDYFSLEKLKKNIIFYLFIFVMVTSCLSALKVGGNAGNTQVGIIFLLPFFILLLSKIKTPTLTLLAWMAVIPQITATSILGSRYSKANQLRSSLLSEDLKKNNRILIDSNTYFAVRSLRKNSNFINLSTIALKNPENNFDIALSLILEKKDFDILVVSHILNFKKIIESDNRYEIKFINTIGIVAIRK